LIIPGHLFLKKKDDLSRLICCPDAIHDLLKEEKHVREIKKKPADLAPEASAAKASAVDGTTVLGDSKTLAIAVETPSEINDASKTTNVVDKPEDKKNLFLA
jgi:hypothetical protein